ncbi:M20 peptidase family dipeptidase [Corticibacter populi]|uniref:M20 peptidase family dipeptidase n=1 Tax=Corticibacter populi TaxID=1550736 RepID=A0A3M6QUH6_9BURK|nr:M20 family metallopeptidase [Corticibacter populi]RMX06623.1 M20 peptidase family dipeptidase [Corticibacter populi]
MTRTHAIAQAAAHFDRGDFFRTLQTLVACPTECQEPSRSASLHDYLTEQLAPRLQALGFECQILPNPIAEAPPFMVARRIEADAAFTVLGYGHGDVVLGHAGQWRENRSPWELQADGDRWYGRGAADNKGQHVINLTALAEVIAARQGRLGYNVTWIFEMGEEIGSPGLNAFCARHAELLRADLFLASDGPRLGATKPTVFLGSRGGFTFELRLDLREGAHHSGNWGGLLRNPAWRLAHALASLVDAHGRILVPGLLPRELPANVRAALRDVQVASDPGDPAIDPDWGEPGLTPAEQVFGWNTLEILAFTAGNPEAPVNAIPGSARAMCQIRFVVGSDDDHFLQHIRAHLDAHGFDDVQVAQSGELFRATRLDPDSPWVRLALQSLAQTTGKSPTLLPNLGGSLPNDVFSETLGLPTVWVPHSYPACSQHAPNEHLLGSVAREGLQIMAGLYWDLAEQGGAIAQAVRQQHDAEVLAK